MKTIKNSIYITVILISQSLIGFSQSESGNRVVITGVRFSYPLVEKWISQYKEENPTVEVVIESRTTTDPAKFDILIEAYEPDESVKESREYLYLARYALLPVANSTSAFAKVYADKGFNKDLFKQIYFSDVFADKKDAKKVETEYTIYTRVQKAGAPITFAKYFGFEQANIKGKAIAGADEHLIKALLKDSTGISYSIPGLLYDLKTRKQINGLTVIPVDIDGNGRVNNEEKFYSNLDTVIEKLEEGELKNIPVEHLHVSISKTSTNADAIRFLQWLGDHSQETLHDFGFIKPDPKIFRDGKEKLNKQLALN